jgi:hypothetical protein
MKLGVTVIGAMVLAVLVGAAALVNFGSSGGGSLNDALWRRHVHLVAVHDGEMDGQDGDHFGSAVALDGEHALVGASVGGAAYMFQRDALSPAAKLQDGDSAAVFAASVAVSGPLALVGAPRLSSCRDACGAAYIYQKDAAGRYSRVADLAAADPEASGTFGDRVALADGRAFVGAQDADGQCAVYVFHQTGVRAWRQVAKITPDHDASRNVLAWTLAVHGELVVVGTRFHAAERRIGCAAYLFERDGADAWRQVAELTSGAESDEWFGRAVAVHDKTIAVGGLQAVYLFHRDDDGRWRRVARLRPPDDVPSFGRAVAISSGFLAVGAPHENGAAGGVYLYRNDGDGPWRSIGRVALRDGAADRWFGDALAIDDQTLLVGARFGCGAAPRSGAAYLFRLDAAPGSPAPRQRRDLGRPPITS